MSAQTNYLHLLVSHANDLRGKLDVTFHANGPDLKARRAIASVFEELDNAVTTVEDAERDVRAVSGDANRSDQFKSDRITSLVAQARTESGNDLAAATATLAALRARLASMALPPRPSDDALSEARLAGLKQDVRLVLDATETEALVPAMLDLLRHYIGRGDALGIWLLAGESDFPTLYVRSRGAKTALVNYQRQLPAVIDPIMPQTAATARILLAILDGPDGFTRIMDLTTKAVTQRLDLLATLANRDSGLIGAD